jgi:hypothetical protein
MIMLMNDSQFIKVKIFETPAIFVTIVRTPVLFRYKLYQDAMNMSDFFSIFVMNFRGHDFRF